MKKKKKPDSIVWDENKEEYIARLLPYGSDTSSPVIDVPNVAGFKKEGVDKASKQFNAELEDLKSKIKKFVKSASDTQFVYSSEFKFTPIVGETYHLYKDEKGNFLSLISPKDWDKEHIGSFRLNSDYKWDQV